jgi:hypothetical protein
LLYLCGDYLRWPNDLGWADVKLLKMSDANNITTAAAAKDNLPSQTPAPAQQHSPEQAPGSVAPTVQRAVSMAGSSSPQTPPASFGALLNHQQSSTAMRAGVLRQLHHSYGNNYVGEVLHSSAGTSRSVQLAGLPETPPANNGKPDLSQKIQAASNGGRGLEAGMQSQLQQGLGADLSNVRVHTDKEADTLARSVNATAFTSGRDIYFSDGAYQPNTEAGMRLLAHEATHTVQQSRGPVAGTSAAGGVKISDPADVGEQAATHAAERVVSSSAVASGNGAADAAADRGTTSQANGAFIQRFSGAGGAPPVSDAPTTSTKDLGSTIEWGGYVLSLDDEQLKTILFSEAKKGGVKGAKAFIDSFGRAIPDLTLTYKKPDDVSLLNGIYFALDNQLPAVRQYQANIIELYTGSATTYTNALLDESETLINKEAEHYGVHKKDVAVDAEDPYYKYTGKMPDQGYEKEMTNPGAKKDLIEAAVLLQSLYRDTIRLRIDLNELEPNAGAEGASGSSEGYDDNTAAKRAAVSKELQESEFKYQTTRDAKEALFPILAAYRDDNTSGLEMLAKGGESADASVVPLIIEKLDHIKTVRENVEKLIWKQDSIRKGTKAQMAVEEGSLENALIDEHAGDIQVDEFVTNLAVGVLMIAVGMIAAIPTGGASLGVSIAATAAATTAAGVSGFQAIRAAQNYQLEIAVGGTTFDKAKAISQEDPSLFWLALDIVAAIIDIHAALAAFKSLSQGVREVIAARALVKEAEAGAKAAGVTEKQLKSLKELSKGHPGLYERILSHIGAAEDIAKPGLKELEAAARAQYQAIAKAGQLEQIKNISEDLFVEQMLSGARMQTVISGAEGVKRTAIITSLMNPENPILRGILFGQAKEMDALLQQHGNWKQLLGMLDQGTPEMRQAARMLFNKRAQIEREVQAMFQAELAGKPSSQLISDIDRSTSGVDAGKKMIQAENYVKAKYGEGWSEALRMNFYTDAMRLSLYENVMDKLTIGQRTVLMKSLTQETEIYNISRMLHHAHGDEAAVKEVADYAKALDLDIKDPRIQELLPKLAKGPSVEERNKLLLEIDGLMKRYNAAAPGSEERLKLAQEVSSRQMRANLFTEEAYIGPGSMRVLAGQVQVVGHEALQYALSNLDMIRHFIAQCGGDVVLASRQYEIYKYMNRFAQTAEMAGLHGGDIEEWKNFTGFVYKGEHRAAMEDISHLRPGIRDPQGLIKGPIMDEDLKQAYDSWRGFSERVLKDLKAKAAADPLAWTPGKDAVAATSSVAP